MSASFEHRTLKSTLIGARVDTTVQFRGIPYGKVTKRFAEADFVTDLPAKLDCTRYGLELHPLIHFPH